MGTMTRLFGGDSRKAISHKSEKLTAPTDASVITPLNPGSFASIRTTPVCEAPRYFCAEEADAMKKLAKQKTEDARHAKKTYKAMGRIEVRKRTPKYTWRTASMNLR